MERLELGDTPKSKIASLSREELEQKYFVVESELVRVVRELYELRQLKMTDEQLQLIMAEQIKELQNNIFGRKSERYKKPAKKDGNGDDTKGPAKPRVKKPSERYPNIPVRQQLIAMDPIPNCSCCGQVMTDSGMTEDSEQLTVIPKKYEILKQMKVKYRCCCHGAITTAPTPPRIIAGSAYSDEMIKDVALSKYCDLIPIERYVAMAQRAGLIDLPANSLIETTHGFADFVSPVYTLLKKGVLADRVLRADETPHRMLEGSAKKSWYLWGFSTQSYCYLECHDTRSGDVASDILLNANCEILVSDVYSGYGKAVREANQIRKNNGKPLIVNTHCNGHSRRYFYKAWSHKDKQTGISLYKESEFYLDHYHEIYQLDGQSTGKPPPEVLELRNQMRPRFEAMKQKALEQMPSYPQNGKYGKALRYFFDHYKTLTLFLGDPDIPIDNNGQERLLRNHVVGRKTWYGTHSPRGALTAAIVFSIVETCKLNHVNPRAYFDCLVEDLLAGSKPYTPIDFKNSH